MEDMKKLDNDSGTIQDRFRTWASVLQLEVLVRELLTVDALSASTVVASEVTALEHELWDDTVEDASFEPEALLSGTQRAKVLSGLGNDIGSQLQNQISCHRKRISTKLKQTIE